MNREMRCTSLYPSLIGTVKSRVAISPLIACRRGLLEFVYETEIRYRRILRIIKAQVRYARLGHGLVGTG